MRFVFKIFIGLFLIGGTLWVIGVYLMSPAASMDRYAKYYAKEGSQMHNGGIRVTFFGVSTLLLDDGVTQLMIDGFFSRPSVLKVVTSKISTDTSFVADMLLKHGMGRLRAIFVTHSHYEHALDAAFIARRTNSVLLGSRSTMNIGLGGGLRTDQLLVFDTAAKYRFGEFAVQVIPSKHSPAASYNDDLGRALDMPLAQPAKASDYVEGGSFDFLIHYKGHTIYIKPSANYLEGRLRDVKADVLFLGVGGLSNQDSVFMNAYYHETVEMLRPEIVIPLHWDNFFQSFSGNLRMNPRVMDKTYKGFDFLIQRTAEDQINFTLLQGGKSIVLFGEH